MTPAIELIGIDKRFGSVHANKDVTLTIAQGLDPRHHRREWCGQIDADVDPRSASISRQGRDPRQGRTGPHQVLVRCHPLGIGMVHQHFMLVDPFTVLENVVLGAEGGALIGPALDKARAELDAACPRL